MYENFLVYRRYFWGKLTLATTLVLVIAYVLYSQRVSPNGATLLGLTLWHPQLPGDPPAHVLRHAEAFLHGQALAIAGLAEFSCLYRDDDVDPCPSACRIQVWF